MYAPFRTFKKTTAGVISYGSRKWRSESCVYYSGPLLYCTFKLGMKRLSFSTTSRSAAPAFRMDRVSPPGPGPTSHTWAFSKQPAWRTILSVIGNLSLSCHVYSEVKWNIFLIIACGAVISQGKKTLFTCLVMMSWYGMICKHITVCIMVISALDGEWCYHSGQTLFFFIHLLYTPLSLKSSRKFWDNCFSALRLYSLMISPMVGSGGSRREANLPDAAI